MSEAVAAGPVLAALRAGTSAHHQRLDSGLGFMRDDFTLDDYRRTLGAFLGFVEPWEAVVLPRAADVGLSLTPQAPRLRQDLRALDQDPDAVPRVDRLPALGDTAALYGSAYVMVGSKLGARIIGPWLMQRFALTPEQGCAYFGGEPDATGPAWRTFRQQLDAAVDTEGEASAVAAAQDTFSSFHDWLRARGAAR